jgi:hypothetical protein
MTPTHRKKRDGWGTEISDYFFFAGQPARAQAERREA